MSAIICLWLVCGCWTVEVEGAVCSGCEVIHSVVCWLETPRRSAPLRDRWPLPARPSLDSATLLASPPLRLSLFHPLLSSPLRLCHRLPAAPRRCCTFTFSFSLLRTTALTNYTSLNSQISPTRSSAPGKATRVKLFENKATLGQLLPTTEILENKVTIWRLLSKTENPSILCFRQLLMNHWTYWQKWDGRRNNTRRTVSNIF